MQVENEYKVQLNEDGSQTTTYVSDKGGDEVDYVTYVDSKGEEIETETLDVQIEYTSGPGKNPVKEPTPGYREYHGKVPTIFSAIAALFFRSTPVSPVLGFAKGSNPSKRRFSKKDREKGFEKSKDESGTPRCEYCKTPLDKDKGSPNSYEADHRKAHAKGGQSTQENLAPSCRTCNRSKGKKDLGTEWNPPNQ
jgi:hypothetical protein